MSLSVKTVQDKTSKMSSNIREQQVEDIKFIKLPQYHLQLMTRAGRYRLKVIRLPITNLICN